MHFFHLLAASLGVVSATNTFYGHYQVSLGNSKSKDISGVQAWQDVSMQADNQRFCSENPKKFNVTATDAAGDEIESTIAVNPRAVHLSVPVNSTYPVTVEVSGSVGMISTVLTNDESTKAIAESDNDAIQYLLELDFCSDESDGAELRRRVYCEVDPDDDDCVCEDDDYDCCSDDDLSAGWCD